MNNLNSRFVCDNTGCGDAFADGLALDKHKKRCTYRAGVPAPVPAPAPETITPAPEATSMVPEKKEDPFPEFSPASPDTVQKLEVGEAINKVVPGIDPKKAAQAVQYAQKRKEALMKAEEKKKNQTPKVQATEEITNILESVQKKKLQIGHWSEEFSVALDEAEEGLQALLATLEKIPDSDNLTYKEVIRDLDVGEVVVVREKFLKNYPASYHKDLKEVGGTVLAIEGEGKGRFFFVDFGGKLGKMNCPFVSIKAKNR